MSTLRTNALEGVDAKNSITIVAGAGNITTHNVQQGLCKGWSNNAGGSSISANDSFNVSSLSDDGLGDIGNNFTNTMANANYAICVDGGFQNDHGLSKQDFSTSKWGTYAYDENSRDARDNTSNQSAVFGDLA